MRWKMSRKRIAAVVAGTAAVTAGTVGVATAIPGGDGDDQDRPIPASELEQAERAALEEAGGGEVTETEVGDEESTYEVEVTLDDGTQLDVQLDQEFRVVGTERDSPDHGADSDG